MEQNKLISIAMATYNGEKYLREQLDSIFNQTYKNIEVIVSDDCSTDGTAAILEEYSQKYGLKYSVNEKNLGFSKNFEKALKMCNGELIAISDQDDIWLEDKLELLLENIGDKTLIHSDSSLMDENGNVYCHSMKEAANNVEYAQNADKHILWVSFLTGHSCLFNHELLDRAMPIPASEPYDAWLPIIASRLNGIGYLHKPLTLFRQHRKNSSKRKNKFLYKLYLNYGKVIYRFYRGTRRILLLKSRGL